MSPFSTYSSWFYANIRDYNSQILSISCKCTRFFCLYLWHLGIVFMVFAGDCIYFYDVFFISKNLLFLLFPMHFCYLLKFDVFLCLKSGCAVGLGKWIFMWWKMHRKLWLNLHSQGYFHLDFLYKQATVYVLSSLPLYEKFVVFKFILILNFSFPGVLQLFYGSFCDSGLSIDEFSRKKLDLTADELSEEKALAYSCLS